MPLPKIGDGATRSASSCERLGDTWVGGATRSSSNCERFGDKRPGDLFLITSFFTLRLGIKVSLPNVESSSSKPSNN